MFTNKVEHYLIVNVIMVTESTQKGIVVVFMSVAASVCLSVLLYTLGNVTPLA